MIIFHRGTSDYFGLNHYTSYIAVPVQKEVGKAWTNDRGFYQTVDPKWPVSASFWLRVSYEIEK